MKIMYQLLTKILHKLNSFSFLNDRKEKHVIFFPPRTGYSSQLKSTTFLVPLQRGRAVNMKPNLLLHCPRTTQ